MPDVQEVFRMATQKVRPDPGALERQNQSQRRRSVTRKASGYALLAILVIAAAVIGVVTFRAPRDQRPAGQGIGEPSAAEAVTTPFLLDLETGQKTLLPENLDGGHSYVASPDGSRLAYSPADPVCESGSVTVANIDGTDIRPINAPRGLITCAPRWSPDGTKLVYQERKPGTLDVGRLVVHDLATGRRTEVADPELTEASWWFLAPKFSPDGQNVLFHLPRTSGDITTWDVWSVPVTGGDPSLVLRNASFPMLNPAPVPEGLEIAFLEPMAGYLDGQRIMTGRPIPGSDIRSTLVEANVSIWWPTMSPDGTRIAYQDSDSVYVVNVGVPGVERGMKTQVAEGDTAEWLDNDTLIVTPVTYG